MASFKEICIHIFISLAILFSGTLGISTQASFFAGKNSSAVISAITTPDEIHPVIPNHAFQQRTGEYKSVPVRHLQKDKKKARIFPGFSFAVPVQIQSIRKIIPNFVFVFKTETEKGIFHLPKFIKSVIYMQTLF